MSIDDSSPLTIRLPDSIRSQVEALAEREGISVEQFIASATGEKLAAWVSLEHLRREAARGRREDLERFLAVVSDRKPEALDRVCDPSENT